MSRGVGNVAGVAAFGATPILRIVGFNAVVVAELFSPSARRWLSGSPGLAGCARLARGACLTCCARLTGRASLPCRTGLTCRTGLPSRTGLTCRTCLPTSGCVCARVW